MIRSGTHKYFSNFDTMKWRTNRLKDLRDDYMAELSPLYGRQEADAMLGMLIARYFGKSRADLAVDPDFRLSES